MIPQEKIAISRGSGDLAVFRYGNSGGRPVLAIHGVTSSHLAWQFLADVLVPRGYTIYAVDLRGRGDSNQVGGPYGMATHAEDMVAVLDHLGIARADVIGHSMGGFVSVALTELFGHRVDRLMLVDGGLPLTLPPGMTVEQIMPLVLGPALERLSMKFADLDAYRKFWIDHPALGRGWNDEWDRYIAHDLRGEPGSLSPATSPDAVARDSEDLWGGNLIETGLVNLNRNVTMIRAERGLQNEPLALYPEILLDMLRAKYPRVSIVTIPDTNHYDIVMSAYGAPLAADALFGKE